MRALQSRDRIINSLKPLLHFIHGSLLFCETLWRRNLNASREGASTPSESQRSARMKLGSYIAIKQDQILSAISTLITKLDSVIAGQVNAAQQGAQIMSKIEDVIADLDAIKAETGDYIAGRDKIDADFKAEIADLTAQLAAGTATAAQVQAGIDSAFQ